MKSPLKEILVYIAIAIIINAIAFVVLPTKGGWISFQDKILFINLASFFAAIPILLGVLLALALNQNSTMVLKVINIIFLIGNGGLLIGGFGIIFTVGVIEEPSEPIMILAFLYAAIGGFAYYKTVQLFQNYRNSIVPLVSEDDLLDDNFGL